MVFGPCSCVTTSCEHTMSVNACGGSQTEDDLFCDGDQIFYNIDSFVYDTYGTTCNADGGSTSLVCSCTSRQLQTAASYSTPSQKMTPTGFYKNISAYSNSMPSGPCQCDIYLSASFDDQTPTGYGSIGNSDEAVYCDGEGDIHSQATGGALYFECGTGYTNDTSEVLQLNGIKSCRCTNSTAPYYGAWKFASTPVAGPSPIPSRVATLGKSANGGSGGAKSDTIASSTQSGSSASVSASGGTSAGGPTCDLTSTFIPLAFTLVWLIRKLV